MLSQELGLLEVIDYMNPRRLGITVWGMVNSHESGDAPVAASLENQFCANLRVVVANVHGGVCSKTARDWVRACPFWGDQADQHALKDVVRPDQLAAIVQQRRSDHLSAGLRVQRKQRLRDTNGVFTVSRVHAPVNLEFWRGKLLCGPRVVRACLSRGECSK